MSIYKDQLTVNQLYHELIDMTVWLTSGEPDDYSALPGYRFEPYARKYASKVLINSFRNKIEHIMIDRGYRVNEEKFDNFERLTNKYIKRYAYAKDFQRACEDIVGYAITVWRLKV